MFRYRKEKGVSLVMMATGLATLLGFAALAIDLGNAFNVQNELQKATLTSALSGASAYNPAKTSSENSTAISNATQATLKLFTSNETNLNSATIVGNVQVDTDSGAVRLQTKAQANTFFIGILGIRTLEVNANAAALNYNIPYLVMNDFVGITTDKRKPTIAYAESLKLGATDIYTYNIQPFQRIQLVCTLPIVNGDGPEITVIETNDLDGYHVVVANDPGGPWYDISATGTPLVAGGPGPQPHPDDATRSIFYGSGSFDLDGTGIENARYIAILDDELDEGYLMSDTTTLTTLAADASLIPAEEIGAEIDAIFIHQHGISIQYDDLSTDDNGDGIIDAHNKLIGDYDKPGSKAIENPTKM